MFGFPKTLHRDNGKEFIGIKMKQFCHSYSIAQVHGAPRTPTTQGLVERGNRTFKENLSKILREKKAELNNWCSEAAYKKNIIMHMMQPKKFHLLLRWNSTMEGNKP